MWLAAMWLATRTVNDYFFIRVFPTMFWHCHFPPTLTTCPCHSPFFTVVLDALSPKTHLLVQSVIQYPSLCLRDKVLSGTPTALYSNSPKETIQAGTHSRPWAFVSLIPSWRPCFLLFIELLPVLQGGLCEIITILDSGVSQTLGHSLVLQWERCHSCKMWLWGHESNIVNIKERGWLMFNKPVVFKWRVTSD